jgi:hypothetical protein
MSQPTAAKAAEAVEGIDDLREAGRKEELFHAPSAVTLALQAQGARAAGLEEEPARRI